MNPSLKSLRRKYGDAAVMGVDAALFEGVLGDGFTSARNARA